MKLLIVDDEPEIAEIYRELLDYAGFQVDSFIDSEKALESIKKNSYDLIITDKKMPKISGLEIIEYVEANLPDTPVLLITGEDVRDLKLSHSKSKIYSKPVAFESLLEDIKNIGG